MFQKQGPVGSIPLVSTVTDSPAATIRGGASGNVPVASIEKELEPKRMTSPVQPEVKEISASVIVTAALKDKSAAVMSPGEKRKRRPSKSTSTVPATPIGLSTVMVTPVVVWAQEVVPSQVPSSSSLVSKVTGVGTGVGSGSAITGLGVGALSLKRPF